jgi:hypothetical protein
MNRLSRQCGILNISQPYRPPRPVPGIAFTSNRREDAEVSPGFLGQVPLSQSVGAQLLPGGSQVLAVSCFTLPQASLCIGVAAFVPVGFPLALCSCFFSWPLDWCSCSSVYVSTREMVAGIIPVSCGNFQDRVTRNYCLFSRVSELFTNHVLPLGLWPLNRKT